MKAFFKRFFKGISWVQILAGALAAGTVFLLSSRLGVTGTVVGAIIASGASTFASQLYQNILNESQKTIKHVAKEASSSTQRNVEQKTRHSRTTRMKGAISVLGGARATVDRTAVMRPVGENGKSLPPAFEPGTGLPETENGPADTLGGGAGPLHAVAGSHEARSAQNQAHRKKRIALIVSIVISLLIVALTAGVILLATHGQGTGPTIVPQTSQKVDEKKTPSQRPSRRAGSSPSGKPSGGTSSTPKSTQGSGSNAGSQQGSAGSSGNSVQGGSTSSPSKTGSSNSENGGNATTPNNSSSSNDSNSSTTGSDSSKEQKDKDQNQKAPTAPSAPPTQNGNTANDQGTTDNK